MRCRTRVRDRAPLHTRRARRHGRADVGRLGQGQREPAVRVLLWCRRAARTVDVDPHPVESKPGVLLRLRAADRPRLGAQPGGERRRQPAENDAHDHEDRQKLEERVPRLLAQTGAREATGPRKPQVSHREEIVTQRPRLERKPALRRGASPERGTRRRRSIPMSDQRVCGRSPHDENCGQCESESHNSGRGPISDSKTSGVSRFCSRSSSWGRSRS